MGAPTTRSVTAIVVGYNHAHCLGRTFDSLWGSRDLQDLQVIYVDNASEDSSIAATSWHDRIQVVRNEQNLGFARAVNQGLALARGRFTALVNPDVALGPECLARLCETLEQRPEVGLVGPVLLDEEGHRQVSLSPFPTLRGLAGRWLGLRTGARRWLIGALVMAETSLVRALGGLDEDYFVYGEDMDLSFRVLQMNKLIQVVENIHITHTGNPRWSPERLVRVYGAYMRFAGKHLGPRERLPLGGMLSLLWLVRGTWNRVPRTGLSDGLSRIWSMQRDRPPTERFY